MVEVMTLASNMVNLIIVNPITCMWWMIHASQLLSHAFLDYLKGEEIVMVHVLSSVEDEKCFNYVAFLKNKVCNHLNNHL
jgi:hypothetical protein